MEVYRTYYGRIAVKIRSPYCTWICRIDSVHRLNGSSYLYVDEKLKKIIYTFDPNIKD